MKKLTTMIVSALLALSCVGLAACGQNGTTSNDNTAPTTDNSQIPNPWQDCDTFEKASEIAGIDITVPDTIQNQSRTLIQAADNGIIQVFYGDGDAQVLVRKAVSSQGSDISGDYNTYSTTKTIDVNGTTVTLKGNGDTFAVAIWTSGDYSFAIDFSTPATEDVISEAVSFIW